MPSVSWQVTRPVLSPGVLAELWREFPECEVVGRTDPARVPLGICAEEAACSHQPKPGAVGTGE